MENIDKVSEMAFHGVTYIIKMVCRDDVLNMEIEQKDNGNIWKNTFTSGYIEEITTKTGNFKKFPVFVKMLLSSITKASDSVFLDILTSQDLEMLKARKQKTDARMSTNPNQVKNTKRYMILTYSVEYDKVHYPLPLNYEENPDVEVLKNTIRRLRMEMEELKSNQSQSATNGKSTENGFFISQGYGESGNNHAETTALKLENESLKEKIKKMEEHSNSATFKKLGAVENDNTLKAKMELEEELENLKKDYVKHIKKMQTKLEETEEQLEKAREDASKARSAALGDSDKGGRRISKDEEYEWANLKKSVQKYQRDIENLNHELESLRNTDKKSKTRIRQLETELESALKRATYSRGSNNSTFSRSRDPSPNNSASKRFNSVPSKNMSPGMRTLDKKTPMNIRTPSNRGTPTRTTPTGTPTRNQFNNSGSKTYGFGANRQKSPANARNTSNSINSQSSVGSYKKTTPTNRTVAQQKTTPQRTNQRDTFGLNKKSPVPSRNFSPTSSLTGANKPKNYSPSPNRLSPASNRLSPAANRLSPGGNRFGVKYNNFVANNNNNTRTSNISNKSKTSNFSDSEDEYGGSNKNIRSMRQPMSNVTSKNNTYGVSSTRANANNNSATQQKLKENIQNFKESQNVKAPENIENNGMESSVEIADISDRLNKLQDLLRQAKS